MSFSDAQAALLTALDNLLRAPTPRYKKPKTIHDPLWGTCTYDPWEVGLFDVPLFQRLRGLKQTGLAYMTYPSAEHSRFQHTLGVAEAAARVFDSICRRRAADGLTPRLHDESKHAVASIRDDSRRARVRVLLRLAALVHDLGHSILSHTSERVFALMDPFPELGDELEAKFGKRPGAAEIVVYLLVTSAQWRAVVDAIWASCAGPPPAPTEPEWQQIGRWVMGIEPDPAEKFLCDILSGPLDADKLDYVCRDAYFAGLPVGYDLHRFVSTVCLDLQPHPENKSDWVRLTLPVGKGVNALEQLVMSRLSLFSYVYHHQKVRAAEAAFERMLAREVRKTGKLAGMSVWELFTLQDAHLYLLCKGRFGVSPLTDIAFRRIPVRVAEFREIDVTRPSSTRSQFGFEKLFALGRPGSRDEYNKLLDFEDSLASRSSLPNGSVVFDCPQRPDYADLEALRLPGRDPDDLPTVKEHLAYERWIEAYTAHRLYCRVFAPREALATDHLWKTLQAELDGRGLYLRDSLRLH